MPAYQDYLHLASNAEDFAVWTPDPELAGTCRRLARSYCALARFHDQIFPLFGAVSDRPGQPCIVHHVCGTKKVMLVEDDGVVRATLTDREEEAGLHVSKYSDPRAALETMNQPDLVISDIDLESTLNGFDVAAAAHERWPIVNVVLISGLPADRAEQRLDAPDRCRYPAGTCCGQSRSCRKRRSEARRIHSSESLANLTEITLRAERRGDPPGRRHQRDLVS